MMATTIIISTKVKPAAGFFMTGITDTLGKPGGKFKRAKCKVVSWFGGASVLARTTLVARTSLGEETTGTDRRHLQKRRRYTHYIHPITMCNASWVICDRKNQEEDHLPALHNQCG
jgi:hypothetical protein